MPSFSSQPQGPSNGEQLRAINAKLDQILKALGATTPTKVVAAAPKAIAPAAKKAEIMPVAVDAPKTEKAEKAEKKKKAVVKKAKPAKK
jgi:predicted ATP-grasp superfamily ATP-dependent carboligase